MCSLHNLVQIVLNLYWWCIIVYVILSWLIAFNVINTYNQFVNAVGKFLHNIIEPVLKPIRKIIPTFGGIDLAPLILLLLLFFAQSLLREYWGIPVCIGARTGVS